jgi:hypothetical protein
MAFNKRSHRPVSQEILAKSLQLIHGSWSFQMSASGSMPGYRPGSAKPAQIMSIWFSTQSPPLLNRPDDLRNRHSQFEHVKL